MKTWNNSQTGHVTTMLTQVQVKFLEQTELLRRVKKEIKETTLEI